MRAGETTRRWTVCMMIWMSECRWKLHYNGLSNSTSRAMSYNYTTLTPSANLRSSGYGFRLIRNPNLPHIPGRDGACKFLCVEISRSGWATLTDQFQYNQYRLVSLINASSSWLNSQSSLCLIICMLALIQTRPPRRSHGEVQQKFLNNKIQGQYWF